MTHKSEEMVEEVDAAALASPLPGKSDQMGIDELVIQLHHYQLTQ